MDLRLAKQFFKPPLRVWICCAMLVAVGTVLKVLSANVFTGAVIISRISLDMLPIYIAAVLFGPVMGGLTGFFIDLLGFFISPQGAYIPAFSITLLLAGVFAWLFYAVYSPLKKHGFMLFKQRMDMRCLLTVTSVQLLINWPLNALWTVLFFGSKKTFWALLLSRLPAQLLCIAVFGIALTVLMPILHRFALRLKGKSAKQS